MTYGGCRIKTKRAPLTILLNLPTLTKYLESKRKELENLREYKMRGPMTIKNKNYVTFL